MLIEELEKLDEGKFSGECYYLPPEMCIIDTKTVYDSLCERWALGMILREMTALKTNESCYCHCHKPMTAEEVVEEE